MKLKFRRLPGRSAVCRWPADAAIPEWSLNGLPSSITRTRDELSIVCGVENIPPEQVPEAAWICLMREGPFALSQGGILASFIDPLRYSIVPIFARSTYDSNTVLVREEFSQAALATLT